MACRRGGEDAGDGEWAAASGKWVGGKKEETPGRFGKL